VLKRLLEDHPNWNQERLLRAFTEQIAENQKYLDAIIEYWFANNLHSLIERPATYTPRETSKASTEIKNNIEKAIQYKVGVLLLEMVMPNGKLLRDCNGAECSKLSAKVGGWLMRISKQIKPNDIVGDKLTEQQVRQLYAKSDTSKVR
jgi:hypothetical protein